MKYIDFIKLERKPGRKTDVFHVVNLTSNFKLGEIAWYPSWRQYCFSPSISTIFSSGCIDDISEFIKQQNIQHKKGV